MSDVDESPVSIVLVFRLVDHSLADHAIFEVVANVDSGALGRVVSRVKLDVAAFLEGKKAGLRG